MKIQKEVIQKNSQAVKKGATSKKSRVKKDVKWPRNGCDGRLMAKFTKKLGAES